MLTDDVLNALAYAETQQLGTPEGKKAWRVVALLEEKLAENTLASTATGAAARLGAVNAWSRAGSLTRSEALAKRYSEEPVTEPVRKALRTMFP